MTEKEIVPGAWEATQVIVVVPGKRIGVVRTLAGKRRFPWITEYALQPHRIEWRSEDEFVYYLTEEPGHRVVFRRV